MLEAGKVEYILEFTDASDPRCKDAWCENITTNEAVWLPEVGDEVYLTHGEKPLLLHILGRRISYYGNTVQVQLFSVNKGTEGFVKEARQFLGK